MHAANVEKSRLNQRNGQAGGRCLRVFLPWSPLFTSLTGTDVQLRNIQVGENCAGSNESPTHETDSLDPNALLPFPVQMSRTSPLPSWQKLPANPLCFFKPTLPQNILRSSSQLEADKGQNPLYYQQRSGDQTKTSQPEIQGSESSPKTKRRFLEKEDYLHYCDACQKGFKQQEKYDLHMSNHIYCEVPGCGFTCRKDRGWKMDEHVNTLHNRPNAPDLVDISRYLSQRRARFPTQDAVKQKVEELYYKAARGAVLPDERRRWMRQHGVRISKRFRSEQSYIVHGKPSSGMPEEQQRQHSEGHDNAEVGEGRVFVEEKEPEPAPPIRPPAQSTGASRSVSPQTPCRTLSSPDCSSGSSSGFSRRAGEIKPTEQKPSKLPLGDDVDGKTPCPFQAPLLHRQPKLAQRVEQQRREGQVPRYYVCNRCGTKGSHWLSNCPTKGDPLYNRHMVWGEPKRVRLEADTISTFDDSNSIGKGNGGEQQGEGYSPAQKHQIGGKVEEKKADAHTADDGHCVRPDISLDENLVPHEDSSKNRNENHEGSDQHDALPPPQVTARAAPAPSEPFQSKEVGESGACGNIAPTKEISRMLSPVAAKKLLQARIRDRECKGRGKQNALRAPTISKKPTLYERLTEEDRLNEKGLLLQAIRFFVARDFFG